MRLKNGKRFDSTLPRVNPTDFIININLLPPGRELTR